MGVKPGHEIYKILSDFESWQLDDPNPGRQEFFGEVMSALENNEMGIATFNIGVPMPKGAGGYFTNHLNLDKICLPSIVKVDEDNHILTFTEDTSEDDEEEEENKGTETVEVKKLTAEEAFAIFVHEACHFLHFSRDNGEFISPLMKGKVYTMEELIKSPRVRREAEFEAGYRSVRYDKMYNLYPGSRQVLETNLVNMMNYDLPNQTPEWKEKYRAKVKPYFDTLKDETGRIIYDDKGNTILGDLVDRDGLMKFQQEIRDKVKKFSEWADPKHEIKLPQELNNE